MQQKESNGKGRIIENGTKITLTVGQTILPAVLNGSESSRALISKLPYSVRLHRYAHDYCGIMSEPLPYNEEDLQSGWLNGDIAFAVDGNYFSILYKDQELSQQFDGLVTMGALSCSPAVMDSLDASISVRIELEDESMGTFEKL